MTFGNSGSVGATSAVMLRQVHCILFDVWVLSGQIEFLWSGLALLADNVHGEGPYLH